METPKFFEDANCDGVPEIMFPEIDDKDGIWIAKIVCDSCVVKEECLDFALETKQAVGVWGGLTERERFNLARRLKRHAS